MAAVEGQGCSASVSTGAGPKVDAEPTGPLVLVIEDDPDIAQLMIRCLATVGYRTLWAQEGHDAVRLAGQHTLAMVLLDWRLPGELWGRALIQRLRGSCPYRLPVVVISGDPAALTEASESGVADYLPKPFQIDDLIHVVDEHCQ